ncbi:class I SAM-dependent DNA methyltransferase [Salirhabdus sp. Marseille-P4669]|uniref:class I SAM-dependent DNA methyltransferase n=1 Tax=Salirhabdus sp. Marseille-P4669 TaxID=2042310 RepID=UPI000C7A9897|nr:class I SAM-dependent methyltransferase [Salirhabdus sp. Marseille-P4669]
MGREFIDLFDEWSDTYDQTVVGHDEEYKEVFLNYENILQEVCNRVSGNILEFGVGTGNLTLKLKEAGYKVLGIEPSQKMRELAAKKVNVSIVDGDFLNFPLEKWDTIDGIVSSYAFHHLTDDEKVEAIQKYRTLLPVNGKIVFADTVFENEQAKGNMIKWAEERNFLNLALDLKTEYYTTIPFLTKSLEDNGFSVDFTQMNDFVWILNGTKKF